MELDDWQEKVLQTDGNIVLRSGRQVGKSTVIAQKAGDYALCNPNKNILVIAAVERQAFLLFEKILDFIYNVNKKSIRKGKDRPTKSRIKLTNGSTIYCLPTGLTGHGIRGYTIDLLIADEAAFIPEEVWAAVTPMLAVTKGDIILLSTPFGRQGYFYRCFNDETFTSFHVSSEDCPRITKQFLEQEKKRMSKLQYAQEYQGMFVDELRRYFSEQVIRKVMKVGKQIFNQGEKVYLGVDVARKGRDDTVLLSLVLDRRGHLHQIDQHISQNTLLTETVKTILWKDRHYNYKKIFIDDQGLGSGVFDPLLENSQTRRKVIPINNSSRSIERDREEGRKKKLLKEDLYNNLLVLMEQGNITLWDDPDLALSLKSVQCEYTESGKMQIFGSYTHIAEALVRAAWCIKEKGLNIYIY